MDEQGLGLQYSHYMLNYIRLQDVFEIVTNETARFLDTLAR